MSESFSVDLDRDRKTTAIEYAADRPHAVLILGHGAGAPQDSAFMVDAASALARRGITIVTFNFLYMEERRRVPDRQPVLEACYTRVIEHVARRRHPGLPLFIGGKSMGGRLASLVASSAIHRPFFDQDSRDVADDGRQRMDHVGNRISGLVFLGYPLHPPGRPDQRRDKHLPSISAPMLFVQGSRDTFGTPEQLRPVLETLGAPHLLHVVEGGDHSLTVTRNAAAQRAILDGVWDRVAGWIGDVIAP